MQLYLAGPVHIELEQHVIDGRTDRTPAPGRRFPSQLRVVASS